MLLILMASLATGPVSAQTLFKCSERGRTVLSNTPCPGAEQTQPQIVRPANTISAATTNSGTDFSSLYGSWHGQVQYKAHYRGQDVAEAHTVVLTTLSIDPQGKVVGSSSENGCQLLGVATPSPFAKTVLDLDVTLSKCRYTKHNRRFSGRISLDAQSRVANMTLTALEVGLYYSYDVKGSLRR